MGVYTNYEVEFGDDIDWDDNSVKDCLKSFAVQYLYLRDIDKPRVMLCVYSQNPIHLILLRYSIACIGTKNGLRFFDHLRANARASP